MRISRHTMFIEIAHVVKKRSTCFRLNVGAVIVVNNSIASIGYNGPPSGEDHCRGRDCVPPGSGCHRSIHAEVNALERVPTSLWGEQKTLYVTDSPCEHCFKELVRPKHKLVSIYFSNLYRIHDHLKSSHFPIYQVMPNGQVISLRTGEIVEGDL